MVLSSGFEKNVLKLTAAGVSAPLKGKIPAAAVSERTRIPS